MVAARKMATRNSQGISGEQYQVSFYSKEQIFELKMCIQEVYHKDGN